MFCAFLFKIHGIYIKYVHHLLGFCGIFGIIHNLYSQTTREQKNSLYHFVQCKFCTPQPFVDCKLSSFHFTAKSILIYVNQEMSREYEGQKFEHENDA